MSDRGQSELLGYILVFSVIVLTVGLVTIAGQAGLVELRDAQRTANMEKGFSVLADNVDDILRGGVPSRATELDLSGGRLALGAPVTVTVRASDAGGEVFNESQSVRPIVYHGEDGSTLVYANGAVILRGPVNGTTMLREPRMLLSPNRTIVPIANTTLDREQLRGSPDAVDRESRVLVRMERDARDLLASTGSSSTLTITLDSPRAVAWDDYLDAEINPGADDCTVSSGTVSCTYTTDSVTAVVTRIAVSFE